MSNVPPPDEPVDDDVQSDENRNGKNTENEDKSKKKSDSDEEEQNSDDDESSSTKDYGNRVSSSPAGVSGGDDDSEPDRDQARVIEEKDNELSKQKDEIEKLKAQLAQAKAQVKAATQNSDSVRKRKVVCSLNESEKTALSNFLNNKMFRAMPMPNKATFAKKPEMMELCFKKMLCADELEQETKRAAVQQLFTTTCSYKRSYVLKKLKKIYMGKSFVRRVLNFVYKIRY